MIDLGFYSTVVDTGSDIDVNPELAGADDPSVPGASSVTVAVQYNDTCGGPISLTPLTPTLDSATPDLDITNLDPETRLVREGQRVVMDVLVVNNGEDGSTVDDPVFTFTDIGDGWTSTQYRITTRGASGPEARGGWQSAIEGSAISLSDLAKWSGGSANNPNQNYIIVSFRGTGDDRRFSAG